MKKRAFVWQAFLLFFGLGVMAGCQSEPISKEKQTIEGEGVTYTFQLPSGWHSVENYEETYGRLAVFGAEDSRSKSGMSIQIAPIESVEKEGFGSKVRKEIALKNGYSKTEDVYMKEYKVNGAPAYKYTFETIFQGKRTWAHYYTIFSEHGFIQLLFYSAKDKRSEERVKDIDASVLTLKETGYEAPTETESSSDDQIQLSSETAEVTITGLTVTKGEEDTELLVLRYQVTNKGDQPLERKQWETAINVEQEGKSLAFASLPENTSSYELIELEKKGKEPIASGKTGEGILLYTLVSAETSTLKINDGWTSEQQEYPLLIPSKEEK